MDPIQDDHLFGRILLDLQLATAEQLERAVAEQGRRAAAEGTRPRLGLLLVELGVLTAAQVAQTLELQGKTLMVCGSCGKSFNIVGWRADRGSPCPECGAPLYVPGLAETLRANLAAAKTQVLPAGKPQVPHPQSQASPQSQVPSSATPTLVRAPGPDAPAGPPRPEAASGRHPERAPASEATPGRHPERTPASEATTGRHPERAPASEATTGRHPERERGADGPPPSATPPPSAAPASPPASPPDAPPYSGRAFGRYRLLTALGQGGMGVVWKAWDTQLQRLVALKQIKGEEAGGAEALERFQREARLAAKLSHPHIVGVHDVGAAEGHQYLTMDFIEGRTFAAALDETRAAKRQGSRRGLERLRHEVGVLADVAGAVAYAHSQGVIHRDLKPANVLLDAAGRAFVMDFGLAKEVEAGTETSVESARRKRSLTLSGQVLGTPVYMSPEQARADVARIGAASDVWALGIMLYEVLTGETPFERAGNAWDILGAVAKDDPVRPRVRYRHVPDELEAVCLAALEKEPARRCGGAAAFEADLRRWLRGEPVEARRPGVAYRVWRKAVRHRWVVGAGAVLVLALAAAGTSVWWAKRTQERVIEVLAQSVGSALDQALAARRKGDVKALTYLRPLVEEAYRYAVRDLGVNARPEPDFYRGRFERALMQEDEALAFQERALRIDPAFLPSVYERGVLLISQARRLREARRRDLLAVRAQGSRDARGPVAVPTEREAEQAYPEVAEASRRALADLGRVAALGEGSPALRARALAARAIAAAHAGDPRADDLLAAALAADRTLDEVVTAHADRAYYRDDWGEAARRYEAAWKADLGYVMHVMGFAESLDGAGLQAERSGQDAGETRRRAIAAEEEFVARDSSWPRLWNDLVILHYREGAALARRGQDAAPEYARALAACDRALALDPKLASAANNQAVVHCALSQAKLFRGEDPAPELALAIAACDRSLAIDPRNALAANTRAIVYLAQGRAKNARGQDPAPDYARALAACEQALALDPNLSAAVSNEALGVASLADLKLARGEDPAPDLARALALYDRALAIEPDDAEAVNNQAAVCLKQAAARLARGEDPTADYARALAGFDRAAALNPAYADAVFNRANVHKVQGDAQLARGQDPTAHYEQALTAYDRALALCPDNADTTFGRALVYHSLGDARRGRGEDPTDAYAQALAGYGRTLACRPNHVDAANNQALLHKMRGDAQGARGEDPTAEYQQAIAGYDRALAINPSHAEAANNRANVYVMLGDTQRARHQDPAAEYAQALAGYDRVGRIDPNRWQGHAGRGMLLERLGRPAEAATAYERALALAGDSAPALRAWLARARAAAGGGGAGPSPAAPPSWLSLAARAAQAVGADDYAAARPLLEQALAGAPAGAAAATDPGARATLLDAHYNLACILALASAGRDGPKSPAQPVPPDAAVRLRDAAFDHLAHAIELGYADRAHLEADSDLAPLRDDPRWAGILQKLAGQH